MQLFVRCPFCGVVFDAFEVAAVDIGIDGVKRKAHRACVDRLAVPVDVKPNGGPKGNGSVHNLENSI